MIDTHAHLDALFPRTLPCGAREAADAHVLTIGTGSWSTPRCHRQEDKGLVRALGIDPRRRRPKARPRRPTARASSDASRDRMGGAGLDYRSAPTRTSSATSSRRRSARPRPRPSHRHPHPRREHDTAAILLGATAPSSCTVFSRPGCFRPGLDRALVSRSPATSPTRGPRVCARPPPPFCRPDPRRRQPRTWRRNRCGEAEPPDQRRSAVAALARRGGDADGSPRGSTQTRPPPFSLPSLVSRRSVCAHTSRRRNILRVIGRLAARPDDVVLGRGRARRLTGYLAERLRGSTPSARPLARADLRSRRSASTSSSTAAMRCWLDLRHARPRRRSSSRTSYNIATPSSPRA